jgi:hypothetical protein
MIEGKRERMITEKSDPPVKRSPTYFSAKYSDNVDELIYETSAK